MHQGFVSVEIDDQRLRNHKSGRSHDMHSTAEAVTISVFRNWGLVILSCGENNLILLTSAELDLLSGARIRYTEVKDCPE